MQPDIISEEITARHIPTDHITEGLIEIMPYPYLR